MQERLGALPGGLAELHEAGETAIALGEGDRLLALFGLADQPRPEAPSLAAALARRRRRARRHAHRRHRARRAGRRRAIAGVDEVHAGLLPAEKLERGRRAAGRRRRRRDGRRRRQRRAGARRRARRDRDGRRRLRRRAPERRRRADVRPPRRPARGDRRSRAARCRSCARTSSRRWPIKAVFVCSPRSAWSRSSLAVAADMGMSLLVTLNAMRLLSGPKPVGMHS